MSDVSGEGETFSACGFECETSLGFGEPLTGWISLP